MSWALPPWAASCERGSRSAREKCEWGGGSCRLAACTAKDATQLYWNASVAANDVTPGVDAWLLGCTWMGRGPSGWRFGYSSGAIVLVVKPLEEVSYISQQTSPRAPLSLDSICKQRLRCERGPYVGKTPPPPYSRHATLRVTLQEFSYPQTRRSKRCTYNPRLDRQSAAPSARLSHA